MSWRILVACVVGTLLATSVFATTVVTLTDPFGPNSTASIDPMAGAIEWKVLGTNQLEQSCWFVRIGGPGTLTPISSLGTPDVFLLSQDSVRITYADSNLSVAVYYTLIGAAMSSGVSDLAQTVVVTNKTSSLQQIHLFQYTNFDLNNTPSGDTAWKDAATNNFFQSDGPTQAHTGPNGLAHWEIGSAPVLYTKLTTASFGNLADGALSYTGDAAWALQWDFSISGGGAGSTSQDSLIEGAVPEPYSLASLGMGLVGVATMFRRRRRL